MTLALALALALTLTLILTLTRTLVVDCIISLHEMATWMAVKKEAASATTITRIQMGTQSTGFMT